MSRTEVGILGATGMVGQHFIKFLEGHPQFDLTWLGASERSKGKLYTEAAKWHLGGRVPEGTARLSVEEAKPGNAPKLLFSAMDASVATEIEQAFASAGHTVVSNSRNHRMDADVPLLVPEINPEHLKLIALQRRNRGWKGQIVTNPNCSTVVLTMALAPLKRFGIERVIVSTMQAVSGAGYPGVASMDILGNVIPYIGNEEEKMQEETQKILGDFTLDRVEPLAAKVSAHCNRVAVVDGHTITVSVAFSSTPTREELLNAFETYRGIRRNAICPARRSSRFNTLPNSTVRSPQRCGTRSGHGYVYRTAASVPGVRLEVRGFGA